MPEHHLPNDPRNWPDDPFQLLGVEPPVSEQDLKRAYTRLIRRFKPEHHPEQFRRVREAYEAALERAKWFGFFTAHPSPSPPPSEPTKSVSPLSPPPFEPAETFPVVERKAEIPRPAIVDPVEEAWKLAVADYQPEAYSRLIDLDRARPHNPDLALRLYWLLAIQPGLDPARSRHDWLLASLTRSRLSGPALELYKRELEANSETGLFEPYTRLLEVDASGGNLMWIARQRLGVAGLKRSWAAIDIDLCVLSERAAKLDEVAWLSFLVGVMGYVGFDQPAPIYERCNDLLAGLRHLELRESWAFDQIEEQQQMARVWRWAAIAPTQVREVVRDAWVAPTEGWKKAMRRAAAWVANDPVSALRQFDVAAGVPECQQVLATFQRLLDDCQPARAIAYPPEVIRGLVGEFLLTNAVGNYAGMRAELLRFLIRDAIDPQELVQVCVVDSTLGPRTLIEHVRADPVLRLVWRTAHAQ
jgi:hypothetical protein